MSEKRSWISTALDSSARPETVTLTPPKTSEESCSCRVRWPLSKSRRRKTKFSALRFAQIPGCFCKKLYNLGLSSRTCAILASKVRSSLGIASGLAAGKVSSGGVRGWAVLAGGCATVGGTVGGTVGTVGACATGRWGGSKRGFLVGGSRKPAAFHRSSKAVAFSRWCGMLSWLWMASTMRMRSAFWRSANVTGNFCKTIKQA